MLSARELNRILLTGISALCLALPMHCQVDCDFWFAVPYLSNSHDNSLADGQGQLCITSFDQAATIHISQPAVTDPNSRYWFAPIVLTLPPYSSTDIPVQQGGLYRASQGAVSDCGIHIESDHDITVYFAQINQNSEIYTLKGRNACGTDFVVPMQRSRSNSFTGYSTIEIIATSPNTTITVNSPVPTTQNPTGTSFVRVLQKGQILTVRAVGQNANDHLGGTVIHSDKPVVVNSTDDSVADWGQDLIGEQLVPVDLAGDEYIAIRHSGNAEDLVLYALPDKALRFSVNGGTAQTLAAGGSTTIALTATTTYVKGDVPFIAFQVTSDGAELGGTVLPRLDCTGSYEVAVTKRFGSQTVNLLVKTPYTSFFTVNGSPLTFAFQSVPNAPGWSWCQVSGNGLFDTKGVMRIHNSKSVFHLAIMDYGNGTCSYGYFSGYNRTDITPFADQKVYYTGETIRLGIEQSESFTDVKWTAPDGSTYSGAEWQHTALSVQDAGWYSVTGTSIDGCPLAQEDYAVLVQVVEPLRHDSTVCQSSGIQDGSYVLIDTVHAGVSILRAETHAEAVCQGATSYTSVWQTRPAVEEGMTYRVSMDYSSPTNTRPAIRFSLHDTVISIPAVLVRAVARTLTFDWKADFTGQTDMIIEAGMASNNPRAVIDNISLKPLIAVQDTVYFHTIDCETPAPVEPDPDPIEPEPEPEPTPEPDPEPIDPPEPPDTPEPTEPTEPTDPPVTPDPPEPPAPDYTLKVQISEAETEVCDGELSFPLPFTVLQGSPDRVSIHYADTGMTLPLSDPKSVEVPLCHTTPDTYVLKAVFTDSVHAARCECETKIRILYQPEKIFAQKWDNVLAIFNPEYCGYHLAFSSYQWYRNGQVLTGENGSYYHLGDESLSENDYYQVSLVREADGVELLTCPFYPHLPSYNRAPAVVYDYMGRRVSDTSAPGIYIVVQDNERQKTIILHE